MSAIDGDWGWVVADPLTPEGTQIDWSQTSYADELQQEGLDGNGRTYALLCRQNGASSNSRRDGRPSEARRWCGNFTRAMFLLDENACWEVSEYQSQRGGMACRQWASCRVS
jgi:hypothetical protein